MEYIHKLPFMLGAFMAIVIGLLGYRFDVSQRDTYIRMAICMVVFYIIGIYIRSTITGIINEIAKKKEKLEKEEHEKLMQEEMQKSQEHAKEQSSKLDFKIDESYDEDGTFGEDFSPLTVKEILRSGNDN